MKSTKLDSNIDQIQTCLFLQILVVLSIQIVLQKKGCNGTDGGFIGGIVFCIIGSVVLYLSGLFEFNIVHCIAVALIIGCTGVCGDLFESLWKRHYGVKDSGNIIPGHGGILDRFDSSLVAIPLAAIYLISFNLI